MKDTIKLIKLFICLKKYKPEKPQTMTTSKKQTAMIDQNYQHFEKNPSIILMFSAFAAFLSDF